MYNDCAVIHNCFVIGGKFGVPLTVVITDESSYKFHSNSPKCKIVSATCFMFDAIFYGLTNL